MRLPFAALAAAFALAACGGGGGGSAPPGPPPTIAPLGTARLVITVPAVSASARARRPAYVSPASKSVSIVLPGGTRFVQALSSSTAGCVTQPGGGLVCTIEFAAPLGTYPITVSTYASTDATGTPLSTATASITVNAGVVNSLTVTLSGVVAALRLPGSAVTFTVGTAATAPVVVEALDPSGNVIVGPGGYFDAAGNPVTITLADSDTSGATSLSTSSVTAPGAAVTLSYNGAAIPSFTVTASAPGVASATRTFTVSAVAQTAYVLQTTPQATSAIGVFNTLAPSAGAGLGSQTGSVSPLLPALAIGADRTGELYTGANVLNSGINTPKIQHIPAPVTSSSTADRTYSIPWGIVRIAVDSSGGVWVGTNGVGSPITHYPSTANGSATVQPDRSITGIAGLPPSQVLSSDAIAVDSQDRVYVVAGTQNTSNWRVYVLPANADGAPAPLASYPYDRPSASGVVAHLTVDQHDDTIWEYPANAYTGGSPTGAGTPAYANALVAIKQNATAPYRAIVPPSSNTALFSLAFDDQQNLFLTEDGKVDVFTPAQSGVATPVQSNTLSPSALGIAIPVTHFSSPSGPAGGSPNAGIVASPSSFSFLASGSAYAAALNVSETGYGGSFTAVSANTAIATVTAASGSSFTVTPVNAGNTTIRVRDASGGYVDVPVTVSITALTLQGRRR